jgi:hypothetical protein
MSAEAITKALLVADAGVAGLAAARIYPVVLPDNQRTPALVYDLVSDVSIGTISAAQYLGSKRARIQLDAYAEDFAAAKALQIAAVKAMRFQRGTVAGVTLVAVEPDNEGPNGWDPDRRLFVCPAQVIVLWRET